MILTKPIPDERTTENGSTRNAPNGPTARAKKRCQADASPTRALTISISIEDAALRHRHLAWAPRSRGLARAGLSRPGSDAGPARVRAGARPARGVVRVARRKAAKGRSRRREPRRPRRPAAPREGPHPGGARRYPRRHPARRLRLRARAPAPPRRAHRQFPRQRIGAVSWSYGATEIRSQSRRRCSSAGRRKPLVQPLPSAPAQSLFRANPRRPRTTSPHRNFEGWQSSSWPAPKPPECA